MLEKEKPDLVDICLPTKFHEKISVEALRMGFSVLCEKPMAENPDSCKRMLDAAKETGKELMIAHCVRFQPEYEYLQRTVRDNTYGAVNSAEFYRRTGLPDWGGSSWRNVASKGGSCLFDLNIHDVDVAQAIFGQPEKLSCKIQSIKYQYDRSESILYYSDYNVKISGAWLDIGEPFSAGYKVEFEKGVLEYSEYKLIFTDNSGKKERVSVSDHDMMVEEIRYFVDVVANKAENKRNPSKASSSTVCMIEMLFESAENGGSVIEWSGKNE